MKIRDRLALILSLTALLVVTALGVSVYVFTAKFHKEEFFDRLEERVQITKLIFLERDSLITQRVRESFLHTLDEELEFVISLQPSGLDSLDRLFYPGLSGSLPSAKSLRFWQGERQGVARRYDLPQGQYAVVVTAVDKFGQTKLHFLQRILLFGTPLCVLLLVSVSWLATDQALKPLAQKIQKARSISANKMDVRLRVENPEDEIGQLSTAFNGMMDRLQAGFEAQKQFVKNASHEILNPLTAIIGEAEVLLEKPRSNEEYRDALRVISAEAERLKVLTQQLLDLEKAESMSILPNPELESLEVCLLEVLEKYQTRRIHLHIEAMEEGLQVLVNLTLLQSALSNLVDNALKYSGDKPVHIRLHAEDGICFLSFRDEGIGIPQEDMANIYQPMHRARNARNVKGHGIGLPLAKKVIELHGGTIDINTQENKGTEVLVTLPTAKRH
jgi:signal transduction histidine kinase